MPVIRTKRAMRAEGGIHGISLLVDDEEALHDIPMLLERHGWPDAPVIDLGDFWRFDIMPP